MKCTKTAAHALVALLLLSLSALPLSAQDTPVGPEGTSVATEATPAAAVNSDALRNAAQNPVASLISVPVQENWNFGIQPGNRTQNVLNIQPVIPLSLGKKWNLITRWITPIIYQPIPVPQPSGPPVQQTGVYGLGDLNPSFFLSPKKSKVIWGIGPTFCPPHRNQYDVSRPGKIQYRAHGRRACAAHALDDWFSCQQLLVGCRSFRSG